MELKRPEKLAVTHNDAELKYNTLWNAWFAYHNQEMNTRKQEITVAELEEIVDNLRYSVCHVDVCKCKVCEIRRKVEAIIERIKGNGDGMSKM